MRSRSDHALFDYLLREHGLKNDAALAEKLRMGRFNISRARAGVRPIGPEFRLRIMRTFDLSWQTVDNLAPPADDQLGDAL